jgi:hypothetical protein
LPSSVSQPYLGIPHSYNDIQFRLHIQQLAESAVAMLNMLRVLGPQWPEWTKAILFKVFVRTKMEYGPPIVREWLNKPAVRDKNKELEPLEKVLDEAMMWIFGTTSNKNLSVLRSLLFLPDTLTRFSRLRATFDFQWTV